MRKFAPWKKVAVVLVALAPIAHAGNYGIGDVKVLKCSFPDALGQTHVLSADIDPDNRLHADCFVYSIGKETVLHFSNDDIDHFTYDGKILDFVASSKGKDGRLKGHLGSTKDKNNTVIWTDGKNSFEAHPIISKCRVFHP